MVINNFWNKQNLNELIEESKNKKYLPSYNNLINSLKKLKDFERLMEKTEPYSKPPLKIKKDPEKWDIQELTLYYN